MKRALILIVVLLAATFMGCSDIPDDVIIDKTDDTTNNAATASVEYDYLGEALPFDQAIRFGPSGYLSNAEWHWHGTPAFYPDGNEMYWSKYIKATNQIEIWYTVKRDGVWGQAKQFTINGIDGAYNCPVFSCDGKEMYFINCNTSFQFTIYKVTREGNSWVEPEALHLEIPKGKILGWSFSLSDNRNIYFLLWDLNGSEHQKIYRSVYSDGEYRYPEALNILDVGSDGVGGPLIAPDESYIIFDADISGGFGMLDLYISFADHSGEFMPPVNLGNQVNTSGVDAGASLSSDGFYLFYTTQQPTDLGYNPYWVKLSEIEALKTK